MPCGILPPFLLQRIADNTGDPAVMRAVEHTLIVERTLRTEREVRTHHPRDRGRPPGAGFVPDSLRARTRERHVRAAPPQTSSAPKRSIHDAQQTSDLPGVLVRSEGEGPHADVSVNEAYDGLGATWRLFYEEYGRDSLDARGLPLVATVHYEKNYDNAFWDGRQMVFGDGDGRVFGSFTKSVDVIGHELAHGFTQYTAGLVYVGQSGALNEHVSDVFGVLTAQYIDDVDAGDADWLVGAALFTDAVQGKALRSMIEPGTAFDDPVLGKDPQPGSMSDYVELPHTQEHDNGGVHINSGIPNRAFALAARHVGGKAWLTLGPVWFDVMTGGRLEKDADFATFAHLTIEAARERYGEDSAEAQAVAGAWAEVEVAPSSGRMRS
ncbi:MAG: M4 family metallopeptidase [Mobilicoccus sp.]|nr:M4 family metallopeptidase [Mobilicoccus sp.]